MGRIYTRFIELKKQCPKNRLMDKVGLVKFEDDNKKYEIYFTRRRANKYSIIHCENNMIEWEQFPVMPRIAGRRYGMRIPIVNVTPIKGCVRIVIIMGKPNVIVGLDEGNFRSVYKYDEKYISRKHAKRKIYKEQNLKLLELDYESIKKINEVMANALKKENK